MVDIPTIVTHATGAQCEIPPSTDWCGINESHIFGVVEVASEPALKLCAHTHVQMRHCCTTP